MLAEIPWNNHQRSFSYPNEPWIGYQEWHNVIYLHWLVDPVIFRNIVPKELTIDTFNGSGYISIVAFTIKNLRPRFIPSLPYISDFHEINLRTYVTYHGIPGIYFFSLEASKILPVLGARIATGLPYVKSEIWRDGGLYNSHNNSHVFRMHLDYSFSNEEIQRTPEDIWLSDRYRLFVKTSGKISKIDVHHHPWILKPLHLKEISVNYKIGNFSLSKSPPALMNYSNGVKVATWRKVKA